MENQFERGPEKIPTKAEVMEVIGRYAENATLVRELSDEKGLYLFEARVEGEKSGEAVQYEYMRKGTFPNGNASLSPGIYRVDYEGGDAVGGTNVAAFDEQTGQWKEAE